MTAPVIAKNAAALREAITGWRRAGESIALVPTMGALHPGHLSLVEMARKQAKRVAVSIFVNPLQFGPKEDLSRYPRPLEEDLAKLTKAGVDLVFLPEAAEMYPPDFATVVAVKALSAGLCGPFRPGHFDGVATVVAKLLLLASPDCAIFGEKDYQQLRIIERMVSDLSIPVRIIPGAIVREADGLAMSSRNGYLNAQERAIAPKLHQMLKAVAAKIRSNGGKTKGALAWGIDHLKSEGFTEVDYVEACDAKTLEPLAQIDRPARLLAAAHLGNTRLIDNISLEPR